MVPLQLVVFDLGKIFFTGLVLCNDLCMPKPRGRKPFPSGWIDQLRNKTNLILFHPIYLKCAIYLLLLPDFCVWKPEMYQIQGPPMLCNLQKLQNGAKPPRKRKSKVSGGGGNSNQNLPKKPNTNQKGMIVTDRVGTPITVFDGASHALTRVNQWKKTQDNKGDIQAAVASCTDIPTWARQCMQWLVVDDGSTLMSCFDHIEIRNGDKRQHFASLQRITQIQYENMLFFDDWDYNIESVGSLGVKCVHTPHGMTKDAWEEGIGLFGLNWREMGMNRLKTTRRYGSIAEAY